MKGHFGHVHINALLATEVQPLHLVVHALAHISLQVLLRHHRRMHARITRYIRLFIAHNWIVGYSAGDAEAAMIIILFGRVDKIPILFDRCHLSNVGTLVRFEWALLRRGFLVGENHAEANHTQFVALLDGAAREWLHVLQLGNAAGAHLV